MPTVVREDIREDVAQEGTAHEEAQSLKARIFSAAIAVFAEHGLAGARMEQIAGVAQTTKRMVVYYFKSKESLYQAVLEHVYARIRETEQQLGLGALPPVEALVQLVTWSVTYHATHADFMRVICMENMQRGKWLASSGQLKPINKSALSIVEDILHRGQQAGIFQQGVDARDVHRLISSFSFYQVSNFYSFNSLYLDGPLPEIDDPQLIAHHCEIAVKAVLRFVIA